MFHNNMSSYQSANGRRLGSPLNGTSYNDGIMTVDPTVINKRTCEGFNNETMNLMNPQLMAAVTTPVCAPKTPGTMIFDNRNHRMQHENHRMQHDLSFLDLSSPGTPPSLYSGSSPNSSRRESIALDHVQQCGPLFSPSPTSRLYNPNSLDTSSVSYMHNAGVHTNLDGGSVLKANYDYNDFQTNMDVDENCQSSGFYEARASPSAMLSPHDNQYTYKIARNVGINTAFRDVQYECKSVDCSLHDIAKV